MINLSKSFKDDIWGNSSKRRIDWAFVLNSYEKNDLGAQYMSKIFGNRENQKIMFSNSISI